MHRGFGLAQELVIETLLAHPTTSDLPGRQVEAAFRKVADAIAWQILGNQLYIARRLFRDQRPPNLHHSNFASVREAAREAQNSDLSNFVLISDLTTFVQVGDLLEKRADGGITIVEVKEGEKNEKVAEFLDFVLDAQCGYAMKLFRESEGEKSFKQLQRMARQLGRMAHVQELVNNGDSVDPDSDLQVHVGNNTLPVDEFDGRLNQLLDTAKIEDWAIDIIDDCLFIAAYSRKMLPAASVAFRGWISGCGWREGYPVADQIQCMLHPLSLPLFNRGFTIDNTFDLLFGRSAIFLALHLDQFMAKANDAGVSMRWSTRKEAPKFGSGLGSIKIDNRIPIAERGDRQVAIGDGVVGRILFHGMRPVSAIEMIRQSLAGGG